MTPLHSAEEQRGSWLCSSAPLHLSSLSSLPSPPSPWVFDLGPTCIQVIPIIIIWPWWYRCLRANGMRAVVVCFLDVRWKKVRGGGTYQ
jgi:hypothetical protein